MVDQTQDACRRHQTPAPPGLAGEGAGPCHGPDWRAASSMAGAHPMPDPDRPVLPFENPMSHSVRMNNVAEAR